MFKDINNCINNNDIPSDIKEKLLSKSEDLKSKSNTKEYVTEFIEFIKLCGNYMNYFHPYIFPLTMLLDQALKLKS